MNTFSKISIIIPVYNVKNYIERCVRSLFEQTLEDIEFIFVNDHSPDNSIKVLREILEKFPNRKQFVHIINHEHNMGVATARNTGLNKATGEYIGWVDPDDYIEPNMFELMYNKAIQNDADMVSCNYFIVYPTHKEEKRESVTKERVQIIQDILEDRMTAHIWNRIAKRSLFSQYNIRFLDGCDLCEDRSLCVKLLSISRKNSEVKIPLYHYIRSNPNSIVDNPNRQNRISNIRNMVDAVNFISIHGTDKISPEKMLLLKAIAKRELLKTEDFTDILKWKNIFPESNKSIFITPGLPFRHRMIGFMTSHHMLLFVRLWLVLKLIKNRLCPSNR